MEGPRTPRPDEYPQILTFLNSTLRKDLAWGIEQEYPTALAASNLHNMHIIADGDQIVSHAMMKTLVMKSPKIILKMGAIGSVVTSEGSRGQGLSTQVLQECIQSCQEQACDLAVLWTGLHDFYRKLNFELCGYEYTYRINKDLNLPATNLQFSYDKKVSAEAIHRLYNKHTVGAVRTTEDTRRYLQIPATHVYTAWNPDGTLAAYAIEGKGADLENYLHDWGGSTSALMFIFQNVRQIKQKEFCVFIPSHSESLRKELNAQAVTCHQGFFAMVKITQHEQLFKKIRRAYRSEGVSNFKLEKVADKYHFGLNSDYLIIESDADLLRLFFGPIELDNLSLLKPETIATLNKIVPIPLWIWGLDSV